MAAQSLVGNSKIKNVSSLFCRPNLSKGRQKKGGKHGEPRNQVPQEGSKGEEA